MKRLSILIASALSASTAFSATELTTSCQTYRKDGSQTLPIRTGAYGGFEHWISGVRLEISSGIELVGARETLVTYARVLKTESGVNSILNELVQYVPLGNPYGNERQSQNYANSHLHIEFADGLAAFECTVNTSFTP